MKTRSMNSIDPTFQKFFFLIIELWKKTFSITFFTYEQIMKWKLLKALIHVDDLLMGHFLNDFLHMDELLEPFCSLSLSLISLVHPLFCCVLEGHSYVFIRLLNVLNYFSIFNVGKSSYIKQGCQHPFLDGYHWDVSQTSRHPA
jgi:hypothetical protein